MRCIIATHNCESHPNNSATCLTTSGSCRWQLCYLVLNVPLYLLLSTKVHAILQKKDTQLRHSVSCPIALKSADSLVRQTVWTTLKEQLPPVLEEYKARLLWSLMPPIMVGALNWLVRAALRLAAHTAVCCRWTVTDCLPKQSYQ